jgi:hypothetical protein
VRRAVRSSASRTSFSVALRPDTFCAWRALKRAIRAARAALGSDGVGVASSVVETESPTIGASVGSSIVVLGSSDSVTSAMMKLWNDES